MPVVLLPNGPKFWDRVTEGKATRARRLPGDHASRRARCARQSTRAASRWFAKYAESFGAKGYRVERTADLLPTLKQALADDTVVVIDCPVSYSENMKLTSRPKAMKSLL